MTETQAPVAAKLPPGFFVNPYTGRVSHADSGRKFCTKNQKPGYWCSETLQPLDREALKYVDTSFFASAEARDAQIKHWENCVAAVEKQLGIN